MTADEKLAKIAAIFETRRQEDIGSGRRQTTVTVSTHARHNLSGALIDMERTGTADKICLDTIRRVCQQLADIEAVLHDGK